MSDTNKAAGKASAVFEPKFVAGLKTMFEEKIAFNQVIGLRIDALEADGVSGHIDMRPELVGHYAHQRLHGGVISAGLDAMGGLAVMVAIGVRHLDEPLSQRLTRFGKLGTIDLRVDYLRPARRGDLLAVGRTLRVGRTVSVADVEVRDTSGTLVAVGRGCYASPRS